MDLVHRNKSNAAYRNKSNFVRIVYPGGTVRLAGLRVPNCCCFHVMVSWIWPCCPDLSVLSALVSLKFV